MINENAPITYVYAVVHETDISGVWTDPKEAVKSEFKYDLEEAGGITLDYETDQLFTVEETVEEMLKPNRDYPYLAKIKVNPTDSNEEWELDR